MIQTQGIQAKLADPSYFSGEVELKTLVESFGAEAASVFYVTFQPGARTHWHSHSGTQLLVVLAGHCRVQRWQQPWETAEAGDVVLIPAGEKHWHGASSEGSMTHIALNLNAETNWLEAVSETQYAGEGWAL